MVSNSIFRKLSLFLYYGIAQYLPDMLFVKPKFRIGYRCRRWLCKYIFRMSGRNLTVGRRAYFGTGNEITIGNNSGIGKKAQIIGLGPESNLSIGDNVMMGPEVMILLSDHGHSRVDIPMNEQSCYSSSIKIEDDVWIGARVIILKGVTIGKGSIIGAGAVVARDIPPYSVAVGTPARAIKSRSGDTSSKEVQE